MDYGNEVKNIIGMLIKNMEKNENTINSVVKRVKEVEFYSQMTRNLYIKEIEQEIVHNDLDCIRKLFIASTPSIDDICYNNNPTVEIKSYNLDTLYNMG